MLGFSNPPVGQIVEPCLEISSSIVLIVEIVGMFPEVADQQRRHIGVSQRIVRIVRRTNAQFALMVRDQPYPARTEVRCAFLDKGLFHAGEISEGRGDRCVELAGRFFGMGRHCLPEEGVIPHLRSIVEQQPVIRFFRTADHGFDRLGRLADLVELFIKRFDVGRMMLVMVEFVVRAEITGSSAS